MHGEFVLQLNTVLGDYAALLGWIYGVSCDGGDLTGRFTWRADSAIGHLTVESGEFTRVTTESAAAGTRIAPSIFSAWPGIDFVPDFGGS
jgi:hypothetical protein